MQDAIDPLVFGHRVRYYRRRARLTLDELGARVGKPAPYLSMLENGKREPRLGLINALADALEVGAADAVQDHVHRILAGADRVQTLNKVGARGRAR